MDEKLLWMAYRNGLSDGTIPDHLCPPFPILEGAQKSNRFSGRDKFTDFKFGWYINSARANWSPLKILEKREHGCIQGLSKFFGYPVLSKEQVKLRTSNLAGAFTVYIWERKPIKIFKENGAWAELLNFWGYPLLSQQRVKLQTSNAVCTFRASVGLLEQKSIKNVRKSSRGLSQGLPKIFRAVII